MEDVCLNELVSYRSYLLPFPRKVWQFLAWDACFNRNWRQEIKIFQALPQSHFWSWHETQVSIKSCSGQDPNNNFIAARRPKSRTQGPGGWTCHVQKEEMRSDNLSLRLPPSPGLIAFNNIPVWISALLLEGGGRVPPWMR